MATKKKTSEELIVKTIKESIKKAAKKVADKVEDIAEEVAEQAGELAEKITEENSPAVLDNKKSKLEALKEKAKALEKGIKEDRKLDLKKKIKDQDEEKENALVPIEDYLKSSIHLGTRVITPDMRSYVYKRRADGLAVFNTALLDDKLREGAEYLSKFAPENVIIVCKREAGWKAVDLFSKTTGIRAFTKKYPAGILTNSQLETFIETDLVFICDPWIDKNALTDANKIKIPVLSVCDTNNYTQGVAKIIPGNNKSAKSLGIIFYLLTKLYVESRGIKAEIPPISEFVEGWETLVPPK